MLLNEPLVDLLSDRPGPALEKLSGLGREQAGPGARAALRTAIHRPGEGSLYYQQLGNLWANWGHPALKPAPASRRLVVLTDSTLDGLAPVLRLFAAAYGVDLEVVLPPFDSVEQLALGGAGAAAGLDDRTLVAVLLSEHWLARHLGTGGLVDSEGLARAKDALEAIAAGIERTGPAHLLIGTVPPRTWPRPAGWVRVGDRMGWGLACAELNAWLGRGSGPRRHVLGLDEALWLAGGRAAMARSNWFRARMVHGPAGTAALARELAAVVAHLSGRAPRALVTDWDNTLWGGEIGELGIHGVVCGVDSVDGLGYYQVQDYLKGLRDLGVLLAGVTRNQPAVVESLDQARNLRLGRDDFAALRAGYEPKSQALSEVARELGFGLDLVVFLDDSVFELVECVEAHPDLDVLRAGPDPERTLDTLCRSRLFQAGGLSEADLERGQAAGSLRRQREASARYGSVEEFLQSIAIELAVEPVGDTNLPRVAQLFQKTNQFNLTTRRHGAGEIQRLAAEGAMGVFSYQDSFGPQGIVSVVALVREPEALRIESWLMSCRVLNRTVEEAVLGWIVGQAAGRAVLGEYVPTARNELVRGLYPRLGFELVGRDPASGAETWSRAPAGALPGTWARLVGPRD